MARDPEDTYLISVLTGACAKLDAGVLCEQAPHEMKRASIIRHINAFIEDTDGDEGSCSADENLITSPSFSCGMSFIFEPERPLEVGDPIMIDDILYGWYDLNPDTMPNPITPNATDVANDIAANPGNYTTDTWVAAGLPANIINGQISYHVVRLPITISAIDIVDEGGVIVNKAWTTLTDGTYNYYVLMQPVAINADVTYTLKEQ